MRTVFICGLGAVSPAGWTVSALSSAVRNGEALPIRAIDRPGWNNPLRARPVPSPNPRPAFLAHPRLRRSSPITHFVTAAALEATSWLGPSNDRRVGIIVSLQSGCVQYSQRFFEESLNDPGKASPMLFPETVFAAPASHIAALIGTAPFVYTLMGDPASFLQAMALGAGWLHEDRVDACVIIGAEETSWLLADALWHLEHAAVITAGAGAVCLSLDATHSLGVALDRITDAHSYTAAQSRHAAAEAMRAQLPPCCPGELLCDGFAGSPRADGPERNAWRDWTGRRISPKPILGEGLMAAGAWQSVIACAEIARGECTAANVSLVGSNQHAIGARFVRADSIDGGGR